MRSYWCFISYRHADNQEPGRQWATWLHQRIETYEVPVDLVGTTNERGDEIPERIFPVFRDEEELPAHADLANPIVTALENSRFLVVLCSPQAVASSYVADEILTFKKLGKSDRLLAALIEGEPGAHRDPETADRECFPVPLRHPIDEEGELLRDIVAEPIAADFRLSDGSVGWTTPEAYRQVLMEEGGASRKEIEERISAYRDRCDLAFLKIIAGILGIPLGTLTERDKAYQLQRAQRRARILRAVAGALGALALIAVAAGIFAFVKREEAVSNQMRAEKNQRRAEAAEGEAKENLERAEGLLMDASRNAWNEAERSVREGKPRAALAYLAAGMRNAPSNRGLVTFAYGVITRGGFPVCALHFDHPVLGASPAEPGRIVVTEMVLDQGTRYSYWDIQRVEQLESFFLSHDAKLTDSDRRLHPWLKAAPTKQKVDSSGNFKPLMSPTALHVAVGTLGGVRIHSDHLSWNHPWFRSDQRSGATAYLLPDTRSPQSMSWMDGGARLLTAHAAIDEVTERRPGRVLIWDLRPALAGSMLPVDIRPFEEEPPAGEEGRTVYGDYALVTDADGFEIASKGGIEPIWSVGFDPKKERRAVHVFPARKEAIVIALPVSSQEQDLTLKLEARHLDTGEVLRTAEIVLNSSASSLPLPKVILAPGDTDYLVTSTDALIAWNGTDNSMVRAQDLGSRDRLGWGMEVAFLPDERSLLVGTRRKLLHLSWPDLGRLSEPRHVPTMIDSLDISPDGRAALTGAGFGDGAGSSGYVHRWSLPDLSASGPPLRHSSQVNVARFIDNDVFVSGSESPEGSDIRLWRTKTGLPVTSYLVPPPGTGQAFLTFSNFEKAPNAEWGTLSAEGDVMVFGKGRYAARLPFPQRDTPEWFYSHFLPLVGAMELTPQGTLVPVPVESLMKHAATVRDVLALGHDTVYEQIARWCLESDSSRPFAPFENRTRSAFAEDFFFKMIRAGSNRKNQLLSAAIGLTPSHPLLPLHEGLAKGNAALAKGFGRRSLALLKKPETGARYADDDWAAMLEIAREAFHKMKDGASMKVIDQLMGR